MPITWLDIVLLAVMLISGLLAMIRGFMREVMSIASWAAAALVTLYFYPKLVPQAKQYITSDLVATLAVVAGLFLCTLIIVSIFTIKISDMVLDTPRATLFPYPTLFRARTGCCASMGA